MFRTAFNRNPYPSVWREMDRLQREMNRLFDNAYTNTGNRVASGYPAFNVWTNEDGAVVTAELPGLKPEDIDISVINETLTLSGHRTPEEFGEGIKYHRRERNQGRFTRTIQLPFSVETNNIEAIFDKGILHISLPRAEAEKPKRIAVKVAV